MAEQERFQAAHNAMVAKNFADDTEATDAKKNYVRNAYIRTTIGAPRPPTSTYPPTIFAQVSDQIRKDDDKEEKKEKKEEKKDKKEDKKDSPPGPYGKADDARKTGKAAADKVVAKQESFETKVTDGIEKRFKDDTEETDEKKAAIQKNHDELKK